MKLGVVSFVALALAVTGCGKSPPASAPATNSAAGNPLTAPVDYLNAASGAKTKAIKTLDLASLNQAIQMFKVQEDRFPKSLDELIAAGLINKVPDAPYGMKIEYDPETGAVRVVNE